MKYPEYLVRAVSGDKYEPRPDRMSVTRLIGPPLIRTLEMLHYDDITEQVEDKLWALDGIGFDYIMKHYSQWGLTNIKLEVPFPVHKLTVVAKLDYYNVLEYVLADLKRTSVWSILDAIKNGKTDWEKQLNIYCWLLKHVAPQLAVNELQIHAFARDWRPVEKLRDNRNYPKKMEIITIPNWGTANQLDYIDAQLKDHELNPERECTPEEKWQKSDKWAVKGLGNKTAKGGKVCNSEAEAKAFINSKPNKPWEIEFRAGECVRCKSYCNVSQFCKYSK
jgi:hypothetical protein